MSRISPAPPSKYEPVFGPHADLRARVFGQAPEFAAALVSFTTATKSAGVLDARLVELVRLRVAFFNQCRTCMATRYADGRDAGVTEDLVCSLERPEEDPQLSDRERAALALADKFATDHLSVDDSTFARLHRHFDDTEIMELCFRLAAFVGFGRMTAILDIQPEELPERFRREGIVSPWGGGPVVEAGQFSSVAGTTP